jgi:hypothetical protein
MVKVSFFFRKEWFSFHEYMQLDTYPNRNIKQNLTQYDNNYNTCFLQYSPNIPLTLEDHVITEQNRLLIKKIFPSFNGIQFTHLNIHCNYISISMLIEIVHLLLNLNSLKILSLPICQLTHLSVNDSINHLLVSTKNKITKVKLDKLTDMKQIHFLINLCPHMQYFELGCMTNMNLETLIQFVL